MTSAVPLSLLAAAMRASNTMLLDMLAGVGCGEDLLDRALIVAIAQANVEEIDTDPALRGRYDTLDELPADGLRRPVSISAVAAAAGMPFETVRRRIQRLVAEGLCEIEPAGVRVPARVVGRQEANHAVELMYVFSRTLFLRLEANGCLDDLAPLDGLPAGSAGAPPVRLVARLACGHFLRMIGALVQAIGDLTSALILMATLRENSEHIAELPSVVVSEGLMPDVLKVPVPPARVAAALGLAESTVNRRLARLVQEGRCLKRKGGVIVATAYVERPEIVALLEFNHSSLLRLFEPLQRLGLLAAWSAEAQAADRDRS
jgi:DNA-binding Lrp family transcriptional regulator